ncbi:MAG: hypothetical protein RLZZ26_238 [Candidatus Parcubacteria bacterium]|jgi:hypothetical protein
MIESIFNFSSVTTTPSAPRYSREITEHERLSTLTRHVEADHYFRTLSTLLGFVEEALADGDEDTIAILLAAVPSARKDLAHLHDNYHIKPRS